MLASGIRVKKCPDLICSFRSFASKTNCRYFSISSSTNAQSPYFQKKLKPKQSNNVTATEEATSTSTSSASKPKTSSTASDPTLSKRQAFKSITPSSQLMHEIRIQGLGENSEMWSFDKANRGNKTIRPWDKKVSPEEWKEIQKSKRLPPKEVWFEERTSKVIEKEQVRFPGMRFVAGATTMKSVPENDSLLKLIRPDLFDDLEEIKKLLGEDSGESGGDEVTEGTPVRIAISAEEIAKLQARKRAKELEIKDSVLQEIAIVGRSNVGKSTMLNKLTESPNTARVSSKPGLTRQLNFYRCGDKFVLVDMPGYGFAFAKEADKIAWKELIEEYLGSRKNLRRIYVMIDARHGLKAADKEFLAMLDRKSKKFQVVLTKCDLVTPPDLARRYMVVQEELKKTYRHAIAERLLMVSSYTGAGMNNLRKDMLFVCGHNILVRERERPKSTLR
ncbi:hypothetical protein BGZ46_003144 [Entomortierella lignicola]|nr:hypothetical protein BGZ46_003144 [Entomortierella lignicola]